MVDVDDFLFADSLVLTGATPLSTPILAVSHRTLQWMMLTVWARSSTFRSAHTLSMTTAIQIRELGLSVIMTQTKIAPIQYFYINLHIYIMYAKDTPMDSLIVSE